MVIFDMPHIISRDEYFVNVVAEQLLYLVAELL